MVRRFYITGGNNVGDPAIESNTITDPYFIGKQITGVFKEGFRYYIPSVEWTFVGDTITITNGTLFEKDEVFIVETRTMAEGFYGDDSACIDFYFPDIIECVMARVNTFFETRMDDPFSVFFDRGLYNQVGTDRSKTGNNYLTAWLVMPFSEDAPKNGSYNSDVTCDIIFAIKTNANYTQQQREDISFFPRLLPVYKQFIFELGKESRVRTDNFEGIYKHTKRFLPYWGGGDVNAPGAQNMWKQEADCLMISGLKLKIINTKCCTFLSSF